MARPVQILDSALDAIGNTPLIRLDKIAEAHGIKCNLLGKVEYFSAGGSVKDRMAKAMVEAAEKEGKLIPGKSVVIEPTSGNTGIGLALACAIKGYPVIITLPNKMSLEKEALLRALGAEVVRTPTEAAWDSPESNIGVAYRLKEEIPGAVILDQYSNVHNPLAHEWTTGPEIIEAVVSTLSTPSKPSSGKVDVIVAGAGTGGTITGLSRAVTKHNKECILVGVDPFGSILALPESLNAQHIGISYAVEGIGYDFIPKVLDQNVVNTWLKTSDEEAFNAVQQLMRMEGLLVGGSSGSALSGALHWLNSEEGSKIANTPGKNVVVLLPDGIRNYMSKPWFLKIALEGEPTPLRETIGKILGKDQVVSDNVQGQAEHESSTVYHPHSSRFLKHTLVFIPQSLPRYFSPKKGSCILNDGYDTKEYRTVDNQSELHQTEVRLSQIPPIDLLIGQVEFVAFGPHQNRLQHVSVAARAEIGHTPIMANLGDVLKNLGSTKVTERQEGLNGVRTAFSKNSFLRTFHLCDDGQTDDRNWMLVFNALFTMVRMEKAEYAKSLTKGTQPKPTVVKRLTDAASTVRWLVEKAVTYLGGIAVGQILNHLRDGVVLRMELLTPIALDYAKAMKLLDQNVVNTWLKTSDEEAFNAVQQLMRMEGLLVGGSSGSALSGALHWLNSEEGSKIANTPGKNVVVLLPDGIRNYMSKPWFLKIALEGEPTPLRETIGKILGKDQVVSDNVQGQAEHESSTVVNKPARL
ncbi:Cystathionine beta-synthase [Leucoagaricus sp. SymC.cos]|nr:Cystathionine beta-synthase [Leucoagaricus sp. SymC.cos]